MSRLLGLAAAGVLATGLLGALGYAAFFAFTGGTTSQLLPSSIHNELPETSGAAVTVLPTPTSEQQQTDQTIAALIDKLEAAIAQGASTSQPKENAYEILNQITTLVPSASLEGLNLVIGMRERFAARAQSAAAAGRSDEAHRLDLFGQLQSARTASFGYTEDPLPPDQRETAVLPGAPGTGPNLPASPARNFGPGEGIDRALLGGSKAVAEPPVLPGLAPVRVVLTVAGSSGARAQLAMNVKQELNTLGIEVADIASVPMPAARLGIGYYFHSDRVAAGRISQQLAPLLGAVDPVALRIQGSIPRPGTIEITIP